MRAITSVCWLLFASACAYLAVDVAAGCSADEEACRSAEETCPSGACAPVDDKCKRYRPECEWFESHNNCSLGAVVTSYEADGCKRCRCFDACEFHSCPKGQQCTVFTHFDEKSKKFVPQASCKGDCSAYEERCRLVEKKCRPSGVQRIRTDAGCERCTCAQVYDECASYIQVCSWLKHAKNCTFGVIFSKEANGCNRCRCNDPCEKLPYPCPKGQQCMVITHFNKKSKKLVHQASCKSAVGTDCSAYEKHCRSVENSCRSDIQRVRTAAGCEQCACVPLEYKCAPYRLVCEGFQGNNTCAFGAIVTTDEADGCERCRCYDACERHSCPAGQQCTVIEYMDSKTNIAVPQANCTGGQ